MGIKTNQKLWIFGDSFAQIRHGSLSWQEILRSKFIGKDAIVTSRGGRDIQTIIDLFLKSLHLINDDDFVILIIPSSVRIRYPLNTSISKLELNNISIMDGLKESIADGFTAYHPFTPEHTQIKSKLIFPLNVMDDSMFEDFEENKAYGEHRYDKYKIEYFLNQKKKLSHQEISTFINTSKTVLENYNNQFYSFSKSFKFKINFFSWCSDFEIFNNSVVISNNEIERDMGKLQTESELYIETNGEFGKKNDGHWSIDGDKKFSEYIIKNNLKYFN